MTPRNRIAAVALVTGLAACSRGEKRPIDPGQTATVNVPRTATRIVVDGVSDDSAWPVAARSKAFEDARGRVSPHAELRFTTDEKNLYLLAYVADEKLESASDELVLQVGGLTIPLRPGRPCDVPGISVAMSYDGTVDSDDGDDEEWASEVAIPWKVLGAATPPKVLEIRATRRDGRHAMAWPREGRAKLLLGP